jgi:cysteine synthase B
VKDRTALGILKESENKYIIESSSGNTAKALGILANLSGKKFLTVTNRIKQKEIEDILRII